MSKHTLTSQNMIFCHLLLLCISKQILLPFMTKYSINVHLSKVKNKKLKKIKMLTLGYISLGDPESIPKDIFKCR